MLRNAASLSSYPTSTWAGLPAAASAQGQIVRVTDVGVAGIGLVVISDGTRWLPLGPQLLARSGVAASVTGTTAETTLATLTVPGGLMGLSGEIQIEGVYSVTNSANNKIIRANLGGTNFNTQTATTVASGRYIAALRNRNSAASQIAAANANSGVGTNASAALTAAVNTAVDQTLTLTGQLALGTETATLETYKVWITP